MKRFLLILGLLLACAGPSWAACSGTTIGNGMTCVQVATCHSTTSAVCTFGSNNTAGNTIIALCNSGTTTTISVADSRNSYTNKLNSSILSFYKTWMSEADSIGSGANTVTFTLNGSADCFAIEISGLQASAFDQSASNGNLSSGTALTVGPTGTTTKTNEVAIVTWQAGAVPAVSTGYTQISSSSFYYFDEVDFLNVTALQTVSANSTMTSSTYGGTVFTLKASSQPSALGSVLH